MTWYHVCHIQQVSRLRDPSSIYEILRPEIVLRCTIWRIFVSESRQCFKRHADLMVFELNCSEFCSLNQTVKDKTRYEHVVVVQRLFPHFRHKTRVLLVYEVQVDVGLV